MPIPRRTLLSLALIAFALPLGATSLLAEPPTPVKAALKPDVALLIKQSTDAYRKMKSYKHTALYVIEGKDPATGETTKRETKFTLALDRPNKFVYRNDSMPLAAAVSDGKTFFNFRGGETPQYTKGDAPADFKGINIVDDVVFEPLATYLIALMLQGDALADKDVRSALEKATIKPGTTTEGGKKWVVLLMPFGQETPTEIYFNPDDHLIGRAVMRVPQFQVKVIESYENVSINKPIEASVFQYTPPAGAKQIEKFVPTQMPNDARRALPAAGEEHAVKIARK